MTLVDGPEVPAHIFTPQPTEDPLLIPTLEIDEHMETLGFWYVPDGDGIKHIEKMADKELK